MQTVCLDQAGAVAFSFGTGLLKGDRLATTYRLTNRRMMRKNSFYLALQDALEDGGCKTDCEASAKTIAKEYCLCVERSCIDPKRLQGGSQPNPRPAFQTCLRVRLPYQDSVDYLIY